MIYSNNNFAQKGQALVELATFGTILLFCLGMLVQYGAMANNQQMAQMKAFRRALNEAYYNHSGPSATVSTTFVEDMRVPSVDNPYGFSERSEVRSGAQVLWDNNTAESMVADDGTLLASYDITGPSGTVHCPILPQAIFDINGQFITYSTAGFYYYPCGPYSTITVTLPDLMDIDGNGVYWRKVTLTRDDIWVDKPQGAEQNMAYFMDINGPEQISSADLDSDGQDESILIVEDDGAGKVNGWTVVDSQQGLIDGDKVNAGEQGLGYGYQKSITQQGTLIKSEDSSGITTQTVGTSSDEQITRHIKIQKWVDPPGAWVIYEAPVHQNLHYENNGAWSVSK